MLKSVNSRDKLCMKSQITVHTCFALKSFLVAKTINILMKNTLQLYSIC